jgi:hypothetical protein
MIEVGARGHISKLVKDHLCSLFRSWVTPGHRSGVAQMVKYVSWISLVCSFSIFQARNDPVLITPRLVSHHIAWGASVLPLPPFPAGVAALLLLLLMLLEHSHSQSPPGNTALLLISLSLGPRGVGGGAKMPPPWAFQVRHLWTTGSSGHRVNGGLALKSCNEF